MLGKVVDDVTERRQRRCRQSFDQTDVQLMTRVNHLRILGNSDGRLLGTLANICQTLVSREGNSIGRPRPRHGSGMAE